MSFGEGALYDYYEREKREKNRQFIRFTKLENRLS